MLVSEAMRFSVDVAGCHFMALRGWVDEDG